MGILPFRTMRIRDAGETANFFSDELGNNTWEVTMPIVVNGNHQGTSITFDIFIGGVVFDDGLLTRTLHPGAYSEFEWSELLKFYKAGNAGANCYRTSVWQGSLRIAYFQ
jgi:hypothetical protein